jgi:hypothetical protein
MDIHDDASLIQQDQLLRATILYYLTRRCYSSLTLSIDIVYVFLIMYSKTQLLSPQDFPVAVKNDQHASISYGRPR